MSIIGEPPPGEPHWTISCTSNGLHPDRKEPQDPWHSGHHLPLQNWTWSPSCVNEHQTAGQQPEDTLHTPRAFLSTSSMEFGSMVA